MSATAKTIPFPPHRRRRSDHMPVARIVDTLMQNQHRRSQRMGIAIATAALLLVINGAVVTTLF